MCDINWHHFKSLQITSTTTPVFIALSELCVLLKQNLIMFVQAIAYFDCLIFIFPNLFWPPYHSTTGPYLFILDGYSAANLQHTFCTFIVTCSICCGNGHIMLQFFFHNKKNYMIKQSICLCFICAMEQKVSCIQWKDLWINCIER